MNHYPDPALASADYAFIGSAISKAGDVIGFNDAVSSDYIYTNHTATLGLAVKQAIARSGIYSISVHVANYVQGDAQARLRTGTSFPLGISGDGWSAPVEVTAGPNITTSFFLRGLDGATFDIVPDANGEAIRITT